MITRLLRRAWPAPRLVLVLVAAAVALLALSATSAPTVAVDEGAEEVRIVLFWGDGCPHCANEKAFLEGLVARHPGVAVDAYEVWNDEENRQRFVEVAEAHGVEPSGVPGTFVAGRAWIGFSDAVGAEIEAVVVAELARIAAASPTPAASMSTVPAASPAASPSASAVELPVFGRLDPAAGSLVTMTALIALVDGFNPCSLWVLSILLAMMLHSGSRRRLLAVGVTFLVVAGAAYGLFMLGLFAVLDWVGYSTWVRVAIAAVVGLFGIVAIKDYFWYGRGPSLSIPEERKPGIVRRSRQIALSERSLLALVPITALLAAGVSLLELPCTAGFPVMWNGILADRGVAGAPFAGLLLLYLLIYLLDELVLFTIALVTMRVTKMQERHGRALKLTAGSVMLSLAAVMLVMPTLLDSVPGALAVFGSALAMAILVMLVAPRLGLDAGEPAPDDPRTPRARRQRARRAIP
jgi:thiol-disulfide isomerase/thioredoxin